MNNMRNPIDVYVVSGFLGAGKTTFLMQFIKSFENQKVGIIVNELGTVSIDGILIEKNGIQMTEITNGSIYCYCKQGDFIQALKAFSLTDIRVLIIENSGMADPSNIHGLLKQGEELNGSAFDYKGAVCVLDPMTFLNHVEVLPSIVNQVRCSNFVILNKIDMVNQIQLEKCREKVLEINHQANVFETMYSKIEFDEIKEKLVDNGFYGETTNKCYNKFMSYSLECEQDITEEQLQQFVDSVKMKLYRMKGFVKTKNKWLHLDVIENYVILKEVKLLKKQQMTRTKIVVIGKDESEYKMWLQEMWDQEIHVPVSIYE